MPSRGQYPNPDGPTAARGCYCNNSSNGNSKKRATTTSVHLRMMSLLSVGTLEATPLQVPLYLDGRVTTTIHKTSYSFHHDQHLCKTENVSRSVADPLIEQGLPPLGPNSFIFMQFSLNILPNYRLVGNPGSATVDA